MKLKHGEMQFELPQDLRARLVDFRQRLWSIKIVEGACIVLSLAGLTYLAVFVFDRLGETSSGIRRLLLTVALFGLFGIWPYIVYRWVWQRRELEQLARLLAGDQPRIGDRLLGVIELVQNQQDRHTSPGLCRAAIQQVADDIEQLDFQRSVPVKTYRRWKWVAGLTSGLALVALLIPGAGVNALQRWLLPWGDVSRYTFTQLNDLPTHQVVAMGEPFELAVTLAVATIRQPETGSVYYGDQPGVKAPVVNGQYLFQLPAQTDRGDVKIVIGDARHTIDIEPKPRPELRALTAKIDFPAYLGHKPQQRDVRSGAVSVVKGSRAKFEAVASRPLASATVNGTERGIQVEGERILTAGLSIRNADQQEFRWTDVEGLSAKSPFKVRIRAIEDRAPSIQCQDLSGEKVILDEQTLAFDVSVADDFGVKSVGIEWQGIEDSRRNPDPQQGEVLLAHGDQHAAALEVAGAFSPKKLGVDPQPVHLRVYAEDYLPGRSRVYSPVYQLYVLNREQHMIWVTQQLEQWERQALDVRDEEHRLLDENRALQNLSVGDLDSNQSRQRLARQAAAERANAQRLNALTMAGEQLVSEALRNPEFNVQTLEQWAQVLRVLKQLAGREMPSVANQLAAAANAAKAKPAKPPSVPSVADTARATGQGSDENQANDNVNDAEEGNPTLDLVTTVLPDGEKPPSPSADEPQSPTDQQLDEAVVDQEKLLAEFNRVMDELKQLLQDLQGSTFVKRLKAAANEELKIASQLHGRLQGRFGVDAVSLDEDNRHLLERLYATQADTARDMRLIQEDLAAYFERTRRENFKQVFDEMKEVRVVSHFKSMNRLLQSNHSGDMIAQTEFWSDKLDRWAEMLVGPGCASREKCPGAKGDSLPPSIVLEVLRILKGEVDLRESTRVAEQIRSIQTNNEYADAAMSLKQSQDDLGNRTRLVIEQLERLQLDEDKNYNKALERLDVARIAMRDVSKLLSEQITGPPTIAAETEAIEALLITKRARQGGGGGGGSTPGGGGGEGAAQEASALTGLGENLMTSERDVAQAAGTTRDKIPEEFRAGMDAYFSALDGRSGD